MTKKISIFENIKIGWWGISQLFHSGKKEAIKLSILLFLHGIAPPFSLVVIEKSVNWIGNSGSSPFPLFILILWGLSLFLEMITGPILSVMRLHLNEKVLSYCNLQIMEKTNKIQGLSAFENPKFHNDLDFLKNESRRRPLNFVYLISFMSKEIVTLCSIFFVVTFISPLISLTIILASVPYALGTYFFESNTWDQLLFQSPVARRMAWFSSQSVDEKVIKESQLYGFGPYFADRYKELAGSLLSGVKRESWKELWKVSLLSLITISVNLGVLSWSLVSAMNDVITTGEAVLLIQGLIMTQLYVSSFLQNCGMLAPAILFFKKFKSFLTEDNNLSLSSKSALRPKKPFPSKEIQFENVSFHYANGKIGLEDFNLKIRSGEKIALVGENGAGKSTFVKLLARFYDPSQGRILVDGIDLREIDIDYWRDSLGVIFQDFGCYHLSVKENIAFGTTNNKDKIQDASDSGGFTPVLKKLSSGFDTQLGREFGGAALSGGEWQKLAMARAFYRKADVYILDEPTAALDPRSEYDVFKRFDHQCSGKTTIFITHRLGSVSMADRIVVLNKGQIVELGSHKDLMQEKGEYSTLFELQSSQYAFSE